MNAASADILNLLLGIAPVNDGTAPATGSGISDAPSFDMLFGALLAPDGGEAAVKTEATATQVESLVKHLDNGANQPVNARFDLFGLINKSNLEMRPSTSLEQPALPILTGLPNDPEGIRANTGQSASGAAEASDEPSPFRISPFAYQAGRIAAGGASGAAMAPPGFEASSLEPGHYAVLDWKLSGETLTLHLAPVDDPGKTLKVIMPAGQLRSQATVAGALNEAANANRRVALDGQPRSLMLQHLDSLFEKLNIRELVVKPQQPQSVADATTPVDKIELRLFAENAGRQVIVQTSVARDVVRTHLKQEGGVRSEQSVPKNSEPLLKVAESGVNQTARAVNVNAALRTEWDAHLFGKPEGHRSMPELRIGGREAEAKADTAGLPDFMRSTTELTVSRQSDMVPRARFMLPDNARLALRPNGKSVQLKIDPEHLGPARLSLTLHNDRLQALVVVDSHQARQAVEGSLDRLLEALARADIKVDYIDVQVDQRGAEERSFRQQRGSGIRSLGRLSDLADGNETVTGSLTGSQPSHATASRIGAGGVNVLA